MSRPWADEPAVFDEPGDAWEWLAEQRRDQEEAGMTDADFGTPFSDTADTLEAWGSAGHGPDNLLGPDPRGGLSVLGINYGVTEVPADDR